MPDIVYDALDKVPEGLREHAKEQDGKVVVKVVPQVKLDEFRQTNITLSQERDALKAQFEPLKKLIGEDVKAFEDELTELRSTVQKVKDGTLKGTDAIQAEVAQRVAQMRGDYERQLAEKATEVSAWKQQAAEADQKFRRSLVDRAVTDAVLNEKSGAEPRALPDILSRAYAVFQVDDAGKLVAKDGEAVIYGSDGATPMTPIEWLSKLKSDAPYFFKSSTGGGASGSQGSKDYGGMTKEQFQKLPAAERLRIAREKRL